MSRQLLYYILFISLSIISYTILADCPGDQNNLILQKTYKDIGEIYKNDQILYIRLDNDEKKEIKKNIYKDKSLEIYLK